MKKVPIFSSLPNNIIMYSYKIKNTINNMVYNGISYKLPQNRFEEHKKHISNSKLGKAMRKHGVDKFYVETVDTIVKNRNDFNHLNDNDFFRYLENEISELEVKNIAKDNSFYNGYNSTKGGGYRCLTSYFMNINEDDIIRWARLFYKKNGRWPSNKKIIIDDAPFFITWEGIDAGFRFNLHGLYGYSSLHEFLKSKCGKEERKNLTEYQVAFLCIRYYQVHGKNPQYRSGFVEGLSGEETWGGIIKDVRKGFRGLTCKYKWIDFLKNVAGLPIKKNFTETQILQWVKNYKILNGKFPTTLSGNIQESPSETWNNINQCFYKGIRGLNKSYGSLKKFLEINAEKPGDLTYKLIYNWINEYYINNGKFPSRRSGSIYNDTWSRVDKCFKEKTSGLINYNSLSNFIVENFNVIRNGRHYYDGNTLEIIDNKKNVSSNNICPHCNKLKCLINRKYCQICYRKYRSYKIIHKAQNE